MLLVESPLMPYQPFMLKFWTAGPDCLANAWWEELNSTFHWNRGVCLFFPGVDTFSTSGRSYWPLLIIPILFKPKHLFIHGHACRRKEGTDSLILVFGMRRDRSSYDWNSVFQSFDLIGVMNCGDLLPPPGVWSKLLQSMHQKPNGTQWNP